MNDPRISRALDREIEIVENDDSLSQDEKNKQICELERDARTPYLSDIDAQEKDHEERYGW